jgi:hypothetical protein
MGRKPYVLPWPAEGTDMTPHLLMAVKLAHYFTFVAQGGVSWMLYQATPWLTGKLAYGVSGGTSPMLLQWWGSAATTPLTDLGAFLLVLGSVYQAMAGAFFIMAVSSTRDLTAAATALWVLKLWAQNCKGVSATQSNSVATFLCDARSCQMSILVCSKPLCYYVLLPLRMHFLGCCPS